MPETSSKGIERTALQLGPNGERSIRRYEKGERPVPGPVAVAIELMLERVEKGAK